MKTLLIKHKDVFSRDSDDIGYCNAVPHQILTMDDRLVRVPHRRVHPNQWEEVKVYLKKWLKLGVLQESTSCYASPAVLVRKKDNSAIMHRLSTVESEDHQGCIPSTQSR